MSGNVLGPYNDPIQHPESIYQNQISILSKTAKSTKEAVEALRKVDAVELIESADRLKVIFIFKPQF